MQNNTTKFEVVFQTGENTWRREKVKKMIFDDMGVFELGIDTGNLDFRSGKYHLFQSTGAFDKKGIPIYQGHILKDENENLFEVFQACGSFFIVIDGNEVILTDNIVRKLEVVGDVVQNLDLVLSKEEFNNKVNQKENE